MDEKQEAIGAHIGSSGFADVSEAPIFTISPAPKTSGGYDITGGNGKNNSIMFMMVKKPKWHHRFFCKLFLGWNWID